MQQEQIYNAAVELLTEITLTPRPANEVINAYTRSRRYIGSKDRRSLTDLVWGVLRHRARLAYLYPDGTWSDKIACYTDGLPDVSGAPQHVQWEVPEWVIPHIEDAETELPALLPVAPIILRVNGSRESVQQQLADEGFETECTLMSPFGLILKKRGNLNQSQCYKNGLVEVQDEASQCVALDTGINPGETILDYCAGAGGKSLIFAQMMNNSGMVLAHDISSRSLIELERRAERAGATHIHTTMNVTQCLQNHPEIAFDHVVIDAPCSGTGTWRRCPDMRWKLTPEQLKELVDKQARILDQCVVFVRSGAFLSYMTCSLTRDENSEQIKHFLQTHQDFHLVKQKQYSPFRTQTDGLFVAVMQRA
ncbi:MAG: RsmB/NOP family class I SAM-dependent RNA methyltransferase [Akkermansia sp.]